MCGGLQIVLGCCSIALNAAVMVEWFTMYAISFGFWTSVLVRYHVPQGVEQSTLVKKLRYFTHKAIWLLSVLTAKTSNIPKHANINFYPLLV